MLKSLLIVGAGSFVGGALRYLISTYMKNICGQGFPWGTLAVNLLVFVVGLLLFLRLPTKVCRCFSKAIPLDFSAM